MSLQARAAYRLSTLPSFGSKVEYADGFRAGYERGYFERRGGRNRY